MEEHANREALGRLDAPFAFGGVPEDGRDYTESRKPLVRVLHALVLVRAVAMIASGWARSLGCAHAARDGEGGRGQGEGEGSMESKAHQV